VAARKEDYLLRMIEELRECVVRALRLRNQAAIEEALLAVVQARERLFARPSAEFASLPVDQQLELLSLGQDSVAARGRCLAYALILKEAALVYEVQGDPALAASAFQLALYIHLIVAVQSPEDFAALREPINDLLCRLDVDGLYPPVKALLTQLPL
jgi:hypothetical protein